MVRSALFLIGVLPAVALAQSEGETLHLIERFTRTGEHALLYEFMIDDPTTFTRPFTAVVPMRTGDVDL